MVLDKFSKERKMKSTLGDVNKTIFKHMLKEYKED
jgi:hypothetical protein